MGAVRAQLEHSRDLMLGALGHDLRNPLGAIFNSAHFLPAAEELSGPQTKAAARILSSGTRMKGMISDLLDFARLRLGDALPMKLARMDLRTACQAAVDELAAANPHRDIHRHAGVTSKDGGIRSASANSSRT